MSAFERAGSAYLAGSRNSLKIVIDGKDYFVNVKDICRALNDPKFHAYILRIVKPSLEQNAKPEHIELRFSLILNESANKRTKGVT